MQLFLKGEWKPKFKIKKNPKLNTTSMKKFLLIGLVALSSCASIKPDTTFSREGKLLQDVETLASDAFEGRRTGTKGAELAREYILKRFDEIGLQKLEGKNSFVIDFSFTRRNATTPVEAKNIIGMIKGTSDKVIVISAHYDHIGMNGDKIFNGADDNASGVGGLLHIASYFAKNKPTHTLVFAAFDAEEMGLQGAHSFVNVPTIPLDKIRMNINMDMISNNNKGELYAVGTFKYPELKPFIVSNTPDLKILFGHDDPKQGRDDWTNQSDQGAFNAKGIPFIYFGVEDHPHYHKDTDEFSTINQKFYIDAVNAILEVTKNLDKGLSVNQELLKNKLVMGN